MIPILAYCWHADKKNMYTPKFIKPIAQEKLQWHSNITEQTKYQQITNIKSSPLGQELITVLSNAWRFQLTNITNKNAR
jgi:hypothetical protein